uniref:TSA: Wollemia nobilis Ref_Wollemi_Transcript_8212_2916 transcribed RNA sequence n=1 Tax=Wollemia nobilis TaxID=56998 RepID=A0A0C9QUQ6_9CONI
MMATISSLQLLHVLKPCKHHRDSKFFEANKVFKKCRVNDPLFLSSQSLSSSALRQGDGSIKLSIKVIQPLHAVPNVHNFVTCQLGQPNPAVSHPMKTAAIVLTRGAYTVLQETPLILQCAPAAGLMIFTIWGLGPLLQLIRHSIFHRNAGNWKKSTTYYFMTSYLRPILLWTSALLFYRASYPVELSSETSQAIKQIIVQFVYALSTVWAGAKCVSSVIPQVMKLVKERRGIQDTRNVGLNFFEKAVNAAVWLGAAYIFLELVGVRTQKFITGGGLIGVLVTLAGREYLTNILSSIMIHSNQPFIVNDWIQMKIDGTEVCGVVERIRWWGDTVVRSDNGESVHIPNHKFNVAVVFNRSRKTHWRINTHFAISHLDAKKIDKIVADMRKVLAKTPQIEQQRLHRRVFLDYIDPESQALMILVSCFVKTSHIEEYLGVKEAINLDLLRIINHHRARLATPIRTVQKMYSQNETEYYEDVISVSGVEVPGSRRFLLTDSSKMNVEDKGKQGSVRRNQESNTTQTKVAASETKGTESATILSNDSMKHSSKDMKNIPMQKERDLAAAESQSKSGKRSSDGVQTSPPKLHLEGLNSMGLNSKDKTLLGAAFERPAEIPETPVAAGIPKSDKEGASNEKTSTKSLHKQLSQSASGNKNGIKSSSEVQSSITERTRGKSDSISGLQSELQLDKGKQSKGSTSPSSPKQDSEQLSTSRPLLKENLPLGVALNGPKLTLPIEGDTTAYVEPKGLAACRNGNGNSGVQDKKVSQLPSSGTVQPDQKDQER